MEGRFQALKRSSRQTGIIKNISAGATKIAFPVRTMERETKYEIHDKNNFPVQIFIPIFTRDVNTRQCLSAGSEMPL
jgi:hypothetical protein